MNDIMQEILSDLEESVRVCESELEYIKRVVIDPGGMHPTWGHVYKERAKIPKLERELEKSRFLIQLLKLYKYLVPGTSHDQINAVFVSADGLRMLGWVGPDNCAREFVRPITRGERYMTCAEFYGYKLPEFEPFRCRKYRFDGAYEKAAFGMLAIYKEIEG